MVGKKFFPVSGSLCILVEISFEVRMIVTEVEVVVGERVMKGNTRMTGEEEISCL